MKTPPGHREAPPVRVVAVVEGERDRRFLVFGGVVLVAIALGFKSDLWAENQVWALGLGLMVVAGRLDYLRIHCSEKPAHVVLQEAILIAFLAGAYIVVVTLPFNPILKLLWILTITFLASYRSFRINGSSIAPSRAFIFAVFVAQVVTFLAWAVTALESYLVLNEGTFAVMLLFAWYINRGLVRHTVEDSFTRNVVFEYVAFAAVLVYLFVSNYQAGR